MLSNKLSSGKNGKVPKKPTTELTSNWPCQFQFQENRSLPWHLFPEDERLDSNHGRIEKIHG